MYRLAALRYLAEEMYDVACEMLDGSYYRDSSSSQAEPTAEQRDPGCWE